jgi:hypothetical protein
MISLDTPEPEQLSTADNALIIAALLSFPVTIAFLFAAREQWIRVLQPQVLVVLPSLGLNIAALLRLQMIPTDATADRAQINSTHGVAFTATAIAVLTVVLNEVFILVETAGRQPLAAEYAPDPTPQILLLTIAVTVLALTKAVRWYRRRSADG